MEGPHTVAETLALTLETERELIDALHGRLEDHLGALQQRDLDRIEQAIMNIATVSTELERLANARRRHTRLLARIFKLTEENASLVDIIEKLAEKEPGSAIAVRLRYAREALINQAQDARQRCDEVEFALKYTTRLGDHLLQALRGVDGPSGIDVYTPAGKPRPASSASTTVDRVG